MSSADVDNDSPAPVTDEARTELLDELAEALGDAFVERHLDPGVDAWARVSVAAWADAARVARERLGLAYFCYVSAIDWLPSPFGKSEEGGVVDVTFPVPVPDDLQRGVTGGETRFQLIARLVSPTTHLGLHLKADVPDDDLVAPTWSGVYAGANWHEREVWEMFGISFAGHPNLTKLYLPGDFEGFPLRKDFPLLSRMVKPWPGLVDVEPMPGEPDEDEATEPTEESE